LSDSKEQQLIVNEIEEKRREWIDAWHNVTYLCCFALWFWAYGLFFFFFKRVFNWIKWKEHN
jgi:hypothetical protein